VKQNALKDVLMTSQVDTPHRSGFIQMGKRPLKEFAALAPQPLTAHAKF
jgi:hypothetical protein